VTFKYRKFLYHKNRSTGSTKEARGHRDSMERDGANNCPVEKESILKYIILYHHVVLVPLFVCPLNLYISTIRTLFAIPSMTMIISLRAHQAVEM
jgi:hypothetical protein